MHKIQIKSVSGKVLFEYEKEKNNFKDTLMEAINTGANLQGANLQEANLQGAYLRGANLYEAKNYYSFMAFDTSKRIVHCVKHEKTWMIKAGCFWGSLEELEERVRETHKSQVYLKNIEILKTI